MACAVGVSPPGETSAIWAVMTSPELAPTGTSTPLLTPQIAFPGDENSLRPQLIGTAVSVKVAFTAEVKADHLVVHPATPLQFESEETL